jgi:hypothetical protein
MQSIGLLIEFKDGKVKEANFGMATAAQGKSGQDLSPWWWTLRPAKPKDGAGSRYGVARIVNISTGSQRLGSRHPGRCGGCGHAAI